MGIAGFSVVCSGFGVLGSWLKKQVLGAWCLVEKAGAGFLVMTES
jgi:hypothetical protein